MFPSIHKKNTPVIRRIKKAALLSALLLLALCLLLGGEENGAGEALRLCGNVVIPSLFPFLVLSSFLADSGLAASLGRLCTPLMRVLFKLPGAAAPCLLMGLIGGYPVGARMAAGLLEQGELSANEATRVCCFCVCPGPAFMISAVGAHMLGSVQAGFFLYAANAMSCILLGILTRFLCKKQSAAHPHQKTAYFAQPLPAAFVSSVTDGASAMFGICAFVVIFSVLLRLLTHMGVMQAVSEFLSRLFFVSGLGADFWNSCLTGILEVTNGCKVTAPLGGLPALSLLAFLLAFSGISVIFQIISFLYKTDIDLKQFILFRILHAVLSCALTLLLFLLFPATSRAFAPGVQPVVIPTASYMLPSSFLLLSCVLFLLSIPTGRKED